MSNLKINSNLFLGVAELDRFQKFLQEDGYVQKLLFNTKLPGIVKLKEDSNLDNFKVSAGSFAGTVRIGSSTLGNNYAIDVDGNVLTYPYTDAISLPANNAFYWISVEYQTSNEEEGQVDISTDGTLSGNGTKFTEVLRGVPNHMSMISFNKSVSNTGEYQVVRVIDDENAVLAGNNFTSETKMTYNVIGTFTPGVTVATGSKNIFEYDSCLVTFNLETTLNTAPAIAAADEGRKFYIARVYYDGANLTVIDKRSDFWTTHSEYVDSYIPEVVNPINSPYSVRWDTVNSSRDQNIVQYDWGFYSTNWVTDPSLNRITILGGQGGLHKDTSTIANNQFNGWRIYNSNGTYSKILSTTKAAGTQINLVLDKFNPNNFTAGTQIMVVPDVEEIEIRVRGDAAGTNYSQLERIINAPIYDGTANIPVNVPSNDESVPYPINITYRWKNNHQYTEWKNTTSPKSLNSGYYAESSFEDDGTLKVDPNDRTITTYSAVSDDGFINLYPASNHYSIFLSSIAFGDKLTTSKSSLSAAQTSKILYPGVDDQVQVFNGALTMTASIVIGLSRDNAVNGNRFVIIFDMDSPITDNGNTISIQDNATGGTSGTLLYQMTKNDLNYCGLAQRRVSFLAYYDGTAWCLTQVESDPAFAGEIRMLTDVTLDGSFDGTGEGQSEYVGWHICNGLGGSVNLSGKFIVGQNIGDPDFDVVGDTGGAKEHTLTEDEMPSHVHSVTDPKHTHKNGNFDKLVKTSSGATSSAGQDTTAGEIDVTQGGVIPESSTGISIDPTGADQPHNNLPPYYVLVYIQRMV